MILYALFADLARTHFRSSNIREKNAYRTLVRYAFFCFARAERGQNGRTRFALTLENVIAREAGCFVDFLPRIC